MNIVVVLRMKLNVVLNIFVLVIMRMKMKEIFVIDGLMVCSVVLYVVRILIMVRVLMLILFELSCEIIIVNIMGRIVVKRNGVCVL